MSSVITRDGDNFDLIARRTLGDDQQSGVLRSANPNLVEPFAAGVTVVIPDGPDDLPRDTEADGPDETSLIIAGARFRFFESIDITRDIAAMDTMAFSAPFEPDSKEFRDTFRPFTFPRVSISIGGVPLFTGTLVDIAPAVGESRTVNASCYSLPAVMGDCTAPTEGSALEWDGADLKVIAQQVAEPFGVPVAFSADAGAPFERVTLEPEEKPLDFLIELAKQRNLLVTSSAAGELLFTQAIETATPVAKLEQGLSPLVSVTPQFNPQEYYSEITGIGPVVLGLDGDKVTVFNPNLRSVVRPLAFGADDTLDSDLQTACDAKLGRMYSGAAHYKVKLATWRDPQEAIWEPNTLLTLIASGAMIYSQYTFLIKTVQLVREVDGGEHATLTLIFPGALRGETPDTLPWD